MIKSGAIDTRSILANINDKYSLFLHHSVAGGRHTVDTHICRPVTVADRYGKSSKVGPDDLDCLLTGAGDLQAFPFTLVSCFVAGSIGANS